MISSEERDWSGIDAKRPVEQASPRSHSCWLPPALAASSAALWCVCRVLTSWRYPASMQHVKEGALPEEAKDTKYSYLWNCRGALPDCMPSLTIALAGGAVPGAAGNQSSPHSLCAGGSAGELDQAAKIVIATDNDVPGQVCDAASTHPPLRAWSAYHLDHKRGCYLPHARAPLMLVQQILSSNDYTGCRRGRHVAPVMRFRLCPAAQALAEELSRRLGRERCWRVRWPGLAPGTAAEDDPEGAKAEAAFRKDANEVLMKDGKEHLQACLDAAEPYPISGLFRCSVRLPDGPVLPLSVNRCMVLQACDDEWED